MSYAHSTTSATPAFHALRSDSYPDGFVDAIIAAGALTAWSDGSVHPVERLEMLVYTRRAGLSFLRRRDVLEVFDQWVRALQHDPTAAAKATFHLLSDCSGSSLAWTVLRAAEHVAAADLRMQDAEVTALRSIRLALGMGLDTFSAPLSA